MKMDEEKLKAIEAECVRWEQNTDEYLAAPDWVAELIAEVRRLQAERDEAVQTRLRNFREWTERLRAERERCAKVAEEIEARRPIDTGIADFIRDLPDVD